MKKSLKVVLGACGTIFILCGGVWLDALRRANKSISEHESRLAEEIARARAYPAREALLEKMPHPSGRKQGFEKEREQRWEDLGQYWYAHSNPALFEEEMILELARTREEARECGFQGWAADLRAETTLLGSWKTALQAAGQDRITLRRRFEALNVLCAMRPSLEGFVTSEKIIEKIDLLRVLRRKSDPSGIFERSPCWREMFSWRILIAKSLTHVEDIARQTAALYRSSDAGVREEWFTLFDEHVHYPAQTNFTWLNQEAVEAMERTLWSVSGASTAVALFRLERGRDPESLSELVPLYLPEVPVTYPSGDRIEFRGGSVGAAQSKDAGAEPWHLFGR